MEVTSSATIQLEQMADVELGNVFAGASLPYGMAKAVADTNSGSNQGGFTTDGSNITGFSSMHDSGTGYEEHAYTTFTCSQLS